MAKKLQKSLEFSDFFNNLIDICDLRKTSPSTLADKFANKSVLTAWKNGKVDTNLVPKLSLELGVPIEAFFINGNSSSAKQSSEEYLAPDEQELLENYRKLSERDKGKVSGKAEALAEIVSEQQQENKPELVPLYYVENRVSAGTGASLSDYEQGATVYVPATPESRRADFVLKISGDSMEPKFYDGEYVLVRSQPVVDVGQIGIFGNNGNGLIKKLGKRDLISLNSNYKPIPITEETTCFGLVLGTTEIISK